MNTYRHTKGAIRDNAVEALLHDPLFRQRIEQNRKGKGSFRRKDKHGKPGAGEASDKIRSYHWPSVINVNNPPRRLSVLDFTVLLLQ